MASTDTRSGFRLPWSSDRSHDQQPVDPSAEEPVEATDGSELVAEDENVVWPESDLNKRLGLTSQPRAADAPDVASTEGSAAAPTTETPSTRPEDSTMLSQEAVSASARPTTKKPSKLMADLSAAIRATAETAREQALAQVDADVTQVVEAIRGGAKEGEDALRKQSDLDIVAIKDWSREEIARIKAETESKIGDRRGQLNAELDAHAAAIEDRVKEVEGTADDYRSAIAVYAARLEDEDDPSLLATMAESMPEAPSLESLADLGDLQWSVPDPEPEAVFEPEPVEAVAEVEPVEAVAEPIEAVVEAAEPETIEPEAVAETIAGPVGELAEAEISDGSEQTSEAEAETAVAAEADAPVEAVAETVENVEAEAAVVDPTADWDTGVTVTEPPSPDAWGEPEGGAGWGDDATTWRTDETATAVAEDDGTPRWAAGETPEGFPAGEEGGDPVDRGAIMAALEAAAEAVVAAESAAESAGQAEAAADVAETAAEMLRGRVDADETDPEAHAAMAARVEAGGVEESYTDRLAKLLPNHGDATGGSEPRQTAVVVSGLVSVASIASFKRHLGRVAGVQGVTVASGPDGEFVFNVNHLPDVSFRDAVPTMPGFAARVTSSAEGTVHVTARDPEAEG
jgi:hypothetical protein